MTYNFKKYIAAASAICAVLFAGTSCEDKAGVEAELALSTKAVTFSAQEEVKKIKVRTNGDISYTGNPDWLTVTHSNTLITLKVEENLGEEFRYATLTITASTKGDSVEEKIEITQKSENGTPEGVIAIPDANFAEYILKYWDSNYDGFLQTEEAAKIEEVDISDYNETVAPISTLKGIEHFVNLITLQCQRSGLKGPLDLSGLRKLTHVECNNNEITELKIDNCPAITSLICEFNQIESLDLQAAGCTGLQFFNCQSNRLKSLDCSGFDKIQHLYCAYNEITDLKTGNLAMVNTLACQDNRLTALTLQDMPKLQWVDCSGNEIGEISLENMSSLEHIDINDNYLRTMDVTPAPKLRVLYCSDNNFLRTIDGIDRLENLSGLHCNGCSLTSLELTGKAALKELDCGNNKLETFTLDGCPALASLKCSKAGLNTLDVTGFPALTTLECEDNSLTTLDVSENLSLATLYARENALTELWMAEGQKIADLKVDDKSVIKYKGVQPENSLPGTGTHEYDKTF